MAVLPCAGRALASLLSLAACLGLAAGTDPASAARGLPSTPPGAPGSAADPLPPGSFSPVLDGAQGDVATAQPPRDPGAGVAVPEVYLGQRLRWTRCLSEDEVAELVAYGYPSGVRRLECATFRAPLDWTGSSDDRDVTISVSRLPAAAGTQGTEDPRGTTGAVPGSRVLFTNPGGPGQPGIDLPLVFLAAGRSRLLAGQDVYGIDPRGTGGSTNVTCSLRPLSSVDYRDRSPENLELILDTASLGARYCDVKGGDRITHVTTANTVRDLDLLRQLLGVPRVNWLGYSAGTWLGAHYATAFPDQVGRFVLDSSVEFTASWQRITLNQPRGFERRFRSDFAPWAARHRRTYGLGRSATEVRSFYEALRADLVGAPVGSYDGPTLDLTIAEALYSRNGFPELAKFLSDLRMLVDLDLRGETRAARRLLRSLAAARPRYWGETSQRLGSPVSPRLLGPRGVSALHGGTGTLDAADATQLAITCGDTRWSGGPARLLQDSASQGRRYPLVGFRLVEEPCMFWRAPRTALPEVTGAGAPEILMIQSEHDPATPLEGARRAAAGFAGAHLLVVRGEGEHGLYAGGNTCVDGAVERFLLEGRLPAEDATCSGLVLPDPGAGGQGRSRRNREVAGGVANPLVAAVEIAGLVTTGR